MEQVDEDSGKVESNQGNQLLNFPIYAKNLENEMLCVSQVVFGSIVFGNVDRKKYPSQLLCLIKILIINVIIIECHLLSSEQYVK